MDNPSTKRKKKGSDFATIRYRVVQEAMAEPTVDEERPAVPEPSTEELRALAEALGRRSGQKGEKTPVPPAVKHVAGGKEPAVLRAPRKGQINRINQGEKNKECPGIKEHGGRV